MTFTYRNTVQRALTYSEMDGNLQTIEDLHDEAVTARDAAVLNAGIYATTTAGLAATTNGEYFSVPNATTEGYLDLYKNNTGSAVLTKTYYSRPQGAMEEVGSYSALNTYSGSASAFYVRGRTSLFDGAHGIFRRDDTDTTSADNGGTILVDSLGRRWKREFTGKINACWFGASTGRTDNQVPINAALLVAKSGSTKSVFLPCGNFQTSGSIEIHGNFGSGIELSGEQTTITCSADAPIISINCRVPDSPPEVRINAHVYGLVLIGPGKANTSSVGIKAQRGASVFVRDVSIYSCYKGLHCFGNLISSYDKLFIHGNTYGIDIEPDSPIEFAPNDLHFKSCQVVDNDRCIRALNFPNGAMTFIDCELEGNNLSGSVSDAARVIEFFNAGKVTLLGCHVEANPGQYNIFFDGNNNSHLSITGCEVIPGDSCGNALYIDNATGNPNLFLSGSRVTNNDTGLGQKQVFLSAGVKACIIGTFAGQLSGTLDDVVWLRDGRMVLGRTDPLSGGTGIIFPTTQRPSTDPNTLDDYEEGVWTPSVIGMSTTGTATYANANGRYTKIGRQVFVEALVNWSGGTGTGDMRIAGLPFTVSISPTTYPSASIGRINDVTVTAGAVPMAYFEPGTAQIVLNQMVSGGGAYSPIPYDAAGLIMISGTYTV